MNADSARALIEEFIGAYNRFDVDAMARLVTPDIEFRNVTGGEVDAAAIGLAEFRALAEQSAELFSSRTQTPQKFEVAGDTVTVEIDFAGTLAADLPGGVAAGSELRVSGRSEYLVRGGKICRITDYS